MRASSKAMWRTWTSSRSPNVLPVFDAVALHVQELADWMLEETVEQRTGST